MKKLKLLMPLAVACTAISPTVLFTSCNKTAKVTTDSKEVKSGDSYTTYKFKLSKVPSDKKVAVTISNQALDQELVYFDPDLVSVTNDYLPTAVLSVQDDGTVEVPVCIFNAPSTSCTSAFDLTFYSEDGTVNTTVSDLKFDYTIDYDVDLKDGTFDPETASKVKPADASNWTQTGKTIGEIYMSDVENKPIIFQSDARYSTSKHIKDAITAGDITQLDSFKAYFNDVYKDELGLNVHMNYEVKGANGSFKVTKPHTSGSGATVYTFSKFDASCSLQTLNGYSFVWNPTDKYFQVIDSSESAEYDLYGRFNGSFTATIQDTGSGEVIWNEKQVTFDGSISSYGEETNETTVSEQEAAFMFGFGIMCLTYDFEWGAEGAPILKLLSNYGKNIPA